MIDGPVTVVNQPDPKQEQRDADQRAQTRFNNSVQIWTLVLLAIAAGAAIGAYIANYKSARAAIDTLKLATSPRLYIEGLRVVNFRPGQSPVFFLRLANAGPAQAENVLVSMKIYREGQLSVTSPKPNGILVPANGRVSYDFRTAFFLPDMATFESWNLTVHCTVTHDNKPEERCYKYNQWPGRRPLGVPVFVPCDFNTDRIVFAVGASKSTTAATADGAEAATPAQPPPE